MYHPMNLFAATSPGTAPTPLLAVGILGTLAIYWLLPKPRGRSLAFGTFSAIAAAVVLLSWITASFGEPAKDTIEKCLFWLFSGSAIFFATVFLTQRNPARGAIAFAFVIVSVCGLFLLLAAPFLMAATIVIYAGAIIVTFLFVLMLSHTGEAADENDRSREPLLGSLAGFCFLGLVLFANYLSSPQAVADGGRESILPMRAVTGDERAELLRLANEMQAAATITNKDELATQTSSFRERFGKILGFPSVESSAGTRPIPERLKPAIDPRAKATWAAADSLRADVQKTLNEIDNVSLLATAKPDDVSKAAGKLLGLRDRVLLLAGRGELPARNVANIGYTLYTEYILAVEMAGAILLVATIGAVAIANRKKVAA
jgi:NADH-quinone oxidoreductase subunit J